MHRMLVLTVIWSFLLPQFVFPQETPQSHMVKIHLSVSGPDSLGASIRANVARELETQEDMVITDVDPHWALQIAALKLECPSHREPTIMVSVLTAQTFSSAPLALLLSEKVDEATLTAIRRITSGLFRFSRHWVETAPADDLQGLAKGIVLRFRSVIDQK